MAAIDKTFTGTLQRSEAKAGWTYLVTDWSAAFLGTRGTVTVHLTHRIDHQRPPHEE